MNVRVDQVFLDDDVHHRVEQRDVGVGLELQERDARGASSSERRGSHRISLVPLLHGVLDPARRDRVVHARVGADDDDDLGLGDVHHRVRDRARADALEQRDHARRVAQARAVVDVVAAKAGSHQLLEQVGLLVAALGRAEAGERLRAVRVAQLRQPAAGELERLFPGRLAEDVEDAVRIHRRVGALGRVGAADQRHAQALRVMRVVEAVAALDAEPLVVGRPVAAVDEQDLVVLDVVGQLAADAAIRAERLHLLVGDGERDLARRHQRAGRAGLHALAAGDAGRRAHRVVHVEDDLGVVAAKGEADHVVDLLVAAGANAARALDARRQVDRHRRVREVGRDRRARREARLADAELAPPTRRPRCGACTRPRACPTAAARGPAFAT